MRWIHITGGLIGIASGLVALAALKGAWLHRRSGMVFVSSILVMSACGGLLALSQTVPGNIIPAVLTFYMVATALLTVKRSSQYARQIDIAAMLVALTLGIVSVGFALFRDDDPGSSGAYPRAIYFVFAAAALGSAFLDRRMIAAGGLRGTARLHRHLARLCGALIVAITSFFPGQPRVFSGARWSQSRSMSSPWC